MKRWPRKCLFNVVYLYATLIITFTALLALCSEHTKGAKQIIEILGVMETQSMSMVKLNRPCLITAIKTHCRFSSIKG